MLDTKSIIDQDVEEDVNQEVNDSKLLLALFATENEVINQSKSAKYPNNKSDFQKRANLPNEFFNYIYYASYRHLFFLACYDDMTYVINKTTRLGKDLPTLYCNGPNYKSTELKFLQKKPFIEITSTKYFKFNWKWIVYETATLKTWRKKTSKRLWNEKGVK